jgi:two-component system sensor kinase FixL
VGAAVEQVDAASSLINDTRRFVKRETPATAQASLADAVALCFRLLQQEVVRGGIHVKVDVSSDLLVGMQPVKLQQILLNLLRNSIEAMGERGCGKIEISASRSDDGRILVTVKDTGIGIDQGIRTELFRPFMTTKEHGLGLGLSLSRSIVNEHGGELWCESSVPGETCICFTLSEVMTS